MLVLVASRWLVLIPMGVLVSVMMTVCLTTFDWHALRTLHRAPPGASAVMLVTVATVVVLRFRDRGVAVDVVGLNAASATLLEQLATHDKPSSGIELAPGH